MLEILHGHGGGCLIFYSPIIPPLDLAFDVFFLYVEHQVEPPHLLTFGVIYCICGKPLNPTRIHFLCCSHGGGMDYI